MLLTYKVAQSSKVASLPDLSGLNRQKQKEVGAGIGAEARAQVGAGAGAYVGVTTEAGAGGKVSRPPHALTLTTPPCHTLP